MRDLIKGLMGYHAPKWIPVRLTKKLLFKSS